MPANPAESRTAFQLLSCQVTIDYDDSALDRTFSYLAGFPQQALSVRKTLRYQIDGSGPYTVREEGDELANVPSSEDVLHIVYGRVYRRVIERYVLSGWVLLHGGITTVGNTRILFLGHKNAGKTTLSTRLLYAGYAVEGDEYTLERNGEILAIPRSFHFKAGFDEQIPELREAAETLPRKSAGESYITAFDPTAFGFEWKIAPAAVNAVVWIQPNHGGETSLTPCNSFEVVQRIVESSMGWGESREQLVAAAARLCRAKGFQLTLGDASEAVLALENQFL